MAEKGNAALAGLLQVQMALKAPKGQYNSFGKYHYRSCEDIIEAAKPLCASNGLVLTMTDSIEQVGDRYYIRADVGVTDAVTGDSITAHAYARESVQKKGMDESQITGTASSYARKYALNGLFAIDDTKDADTDEYTARTGAQNGAGRTKSADATNHIDRPQNDAERAMQSARHRMAAEVKRLAATGDELKAVCQKHFGKLNSKALNIDELNQLTEKMEDWIAEECRNM